MLLSIGVLNRVMILTAESFNPSNKQPDLVWHTSQGINSFCSKK